MKASELNEINLELGQLVSDVEKVVQKQKKLALDILSGLQWVKRITSDTWITTIEASVSIQEREQLEGSIKDIIIRTKVMCGKIKKFRDLDEEGFWKHLGHDIKTILTTLPDDITSGRFAMA